LLSDPRNRELITLLQADARMGVAELARRIGMSAPSVKERLTRLEEAGINRGYRLDLDTRALGWPLMAYVRVRPMPGQLTKVVELAAALPQVAECHRVTGEDCFILKIYLSSLESLDDVLDRFLVFGQTTTSLVQSSPVHGRPPPLPALMRGKSEGAAGLSPRYSSPIARRGTIMPNASPPGPSRGRLDIGGTGAGGVGEGAVAPATWVLFA
jgi:Lrp/AsnC family leucine-responsive transcriptional regulator